ncbi:hypothetical protein Tco_1133778 [Tanacetum coccineum]
MSTQQDIYAIRAERLADTHDPLALMANTQTSFHPDQPSHITYMQQPMQNPEDISDPATAIDMALVLIAKAFKLNNKTPTNNNQRSSSNPRNMQITQPGDIDEIEEVNANCTLKDNLQQASTSGTQTDSAPVYDSDGSAESCEELYFSNSSKTASVSKSVSKSISISNEEFLDDASPKAAKFVPDFKSLAKEADESLAKHKALEFEIERLLRAVVSQDIMSIVQSNSVVDTSNLQTGLDRTKEKMENCIIKKETEYVKLWNDWYKNCASNTLDPVSQRLEDENVSLEFQTNALSKLVTSDSAPLSRESIVVNNERLIAPRIFRINPFKASRVDYFVPNKPVKASVRTKPIIVAQPHVITKKDYVNGMKSRKNNQSANVSKSANQKKHKANVKKLKKSGSKESLASPRPSKPRTCLRWLPTSRIFNLCGKITSSSNTDSKSNTSVSDNASASNPLEPPSKRFPNSTSFFAMFTILQRHNTCIHPLDGL